MSYSTTELQPAPIAIAATLPLEALDYAEPVRSLELALSLPVSPTAEPRADLTPPTTKHGFSYWFSKEFRSQLRKMSPWLISGGIIGLDLIVKAPLMVLGFGIVSLTVKVLRTMIRRSPLMQRILKAVFAKLGVDHDKMMKMTAPMTAGIAGGAWINMVSASHAIFFQAAQTYATTILGAGGGATNVTALIPLIFGVLRLIFVLYIGISLVRVISAFQNDQDWQTAARVPLITIMCVMIGDALCNLIVQA